MMRRMLVTIVFVLIGAGIGVGGTVLMMQSKMKAGQAEVEDLKSQLQDAQARSQQKMDAAESVIVKLKSELTRSRNDSQRFRSELGKVKTELSVVKAAFTKVNRKDPGVVSRGRSQIPSGSTTASGGRKPNGEIREYIIKDGDSFWKIAASELGNGARYKEIIELNPEMPPSKPLKIGAKLRVPVK